MRVDRDFKLDFDDVLIRPKRSTLSSRRLVDLNRKFEFRHSNETWEGIPVIAANMDTTGTFEIAESLKKEKMLTAIHKFYSLNWLLKSKGTSVPGKPGIGTARIIHGLEQISGFH